MSIKWTIDDFATFFRSVHGQDRPPFKWQRALVERVMSDGWPGCISLPTGAGKSAVMDVWAFCLAAEADNPPAERRVPRRLWFVVDRRVVVDAAYDRARRLQESLNDPSHAAVSAVAQRLRHLARLRSCPPLEVARLRGGILKGDEGLRVPTQPAILCSTVDQIGSRLLFRGYGIGAGSRSIHAGLAGNDSLIVLDEAHCAQPMLQTLQAIDRFRRPPWVDDPIVGPFGVLVMSATPPQGIDPPAIFPRPEQRRELLGDPALSCRLDVPKPAELLSVGKGSDALVDAAVERVRRMVAGNRRKIAVMVNRVATAKAVAERLHSSSAGEETLIHLLTGRMRPAERDPLVEERLQPFLAAGSDRLPDLPIILVTTQCLEVGADLSFDGLITQCASLDALRQRFGRLNRLGNETATDAAILLAPDDRKVNSPDPIYGEAISRTADWLEAHIVEQETSIAAAGQPKRKKKPATVLSIDMGVSALQASLDELSDDQLADLAAPHDDAAILLPAHLDMLAQTAPAPSPDPDVSVYLHGPVGTPEANLIWRKGIDFEAALDADPSAAREAQAAQQAVLDAVPPLAAEALTVPIWALQRWLAGTSLHRDEASDVEGRSAEPGRTADEVAEAVPFLIYRGRDQLVWDAELAGIRPGDTVLVADDRQADERALRLAHHFCRPLHCPQSLDIAEEAYERNRRQPIWRLFPDTLARLNAPHAQTLIEIAFGGEGLADDLLDRLHDLGGDLDADANPQLRDRALWWADPIRRDEVQVDFVNGRLCLLSMPRGTLDREASPDLDEAELQAHDRPVPLQSHLAQVAATAADLAEGCLGPHGRAAFECAGWLHDIGKADHRFQIARMYRGSENDFRAAQRGDPGTALRAKSGDRYRAGTAALDRSVDLPRRFRHEAASLQLAESCDLNEHHELSLHLIASHHGNARPFLPVVADTAPPELDATSLVRSLKLGPDERRKMIPPHRPNSGVADRFFGLQRRYGWWGLAYLEGIFRLADWYASARPDPARPVDEPPQLTPRSSQSPDPDPYALELTGLDGSNPLAFLAALGLLRTLTVAHPGKTINMRWGEDKFGLWRPIISGWTPPDPLADLDEIQAAFLSHVTERVRRYHVDDPEIGPECHGIAHFGHEIGVPQKDFVAFVKASVAWADASHEGAWVSAREPVTFAGAYSFPFQEANRSANKTPASLLSLTENSSGLRILRDWREMLASLTFQQLGDALFYPWRYDSYSTDKRFLWDPRETRSYAIEAIDPKNKRRNPLPVMQGANVLAFLAFPAFVTSNEQVGKRVRAAGFDTLPGGGTGLTWPIWEDYLSFSASQALLCHPCRWREDVTVRSQTAVTAVFRAARRTRNNRPSFAPAEQI